MPPSTPSGRIGPRPPPPGLLLQLHPDQRPEPVRVGDRQFPLDQPVHFEPSHDPLPAELGAEVELSSRPEGRLTRAAPSPPLLESFGGRDRREDGGAAPGYREVKEDVGHGEVYREGDHARRPA